MFGFYTASAIQKRLSSGSPTATFAFISALGPQDANGDVPFDYYISNTASVKFYGSTSATPPSQVDFQNNTGAAFNFTEVLNVSGGAINAIIDSGLDDTYYLHASTDNGATIVTSTGTAINTVIPAITSTSFDDATDVWEVTTDTASNGNWHWARYPNGTTGITPDGSGGWSSAPDESGTLAVGASPADLLIPETGTTGVEYELFLYQRTTTGTDSNILTVGYTADNTAPILSSVTLVGGSTIADLDYSTDEGNGTAYFVLTTSSQSPNNQQIIDGEDHTGSAAVSSGFATIITPGPQTQVNFTGLTNDITYHAHIFHRDAHANDSLQSTDSATPTGSWAPATDDGGITHHWDASLTGDITADGNGVSSIADQVGSNALTESDNALKPSTGTRTQNSLNVVDFDGTELMGDTSIPITSANMAVHGCFLIDTVNNSADSIMSLANTGTDFSFDANNASQFDGRVNFDGASNIIATGGPYSGLIRFTIELDAAADTATLWIDGTQRGQITDYLTDITGNFTVWVCANRNGSQQLDGGFCEMAISTELGNSADYDTYFSNKWIP